MPQRQPRHPGSVSARRAECIGQKLHRSADKYQNSEQNQPNRIFFPTDLHVAGQKSTVRWRRSPVKRSAALAPATCDAATLSGTIWDGTVGRAV